MNTSPKLRDFSSKFSSVESNGFASTHEYDGRARLKAWTDPEGFLWQYEYDGIQNITNITDALGGHYTMAYGPRNERILERNQDEFQWRYRYDALLRLKEQVEPNGTTRTNEYDAGGRLLSVEFSTRRVNTLLYDDNDNPTLLSRIGSGVPTTTSIGYDELDRVRETIDAFNQKVEFGYDARGLRTMLIYPDGKALENSFDAAGRLTNQVFNGRWTNSYAYDPVGRLRNRVYPNGVVQANTFDTSSRLTSLTYAPTAITSSSINIALTYAYDRNGNKTSSTEKGTLEWLMPPLTDETAAYTPAGRLIDRQITALDGLSSQPVELNYNYDASGNMTNAASATQSWDLSYDEDNRTTAIRWTTNGVASTIQNRYDALGRRVARMLNGVETRYVLDLAGGMERILCDMNGAGTISAWYVHGPDLSFKVDAASNLTCYHADATANIIALSDGSANTIAQYAYTPYGRVLGSVSLGSQVSNPYLFVGSQGVMEELPGLYFMRARYYSAESAMFLTTDPVKQIGPGWKPAVYLYADGNPFSLVDPKGTTAEHWTAMSSQESYKEYEDRLKAGLEDVLHSMARTGERGNYWTSYYEDALALAQSGMERNSSGFLHSLLGWSPFHKGPDFRHSSGKHFVLPWFLGGNKDDFEWHYDSVSAILRSGKAAIPQHILLDATPHFLKDLSAKGLAVGKSLGSVAQSAAERALAMSARSIGAAKYANAANMLQGAVGKLASGAISLAAPIVGGFAADAFGRILPKSTPPVLREAAKLAVSYAVTTVVQAAAPALGAAVGVAVVGTTAAAISVGKVIVAAVIAIGAPKEVPILLGLLITATLFEYWRLRRRARKRDLTSMVRAFS